MDRFVFVFFKVLNSNINMQIKGFENKTGTIETPNDSGNIEKPLESTNKSTQRVDINVLKSKLRERENVVLKKNIVILLSCLAIIVIAGISLTYQ